MTLYDTDFYAWTQAQARALKGRDVAALDWQNVLEEIESLGRSEKRALQSGLQLTLTHLLKLAYTLGRSDPRRGWRISARGGRRVAQRALAEQRSLRAQLGEVLSLAYGYAKQDAHDELTDHGDAHAPFPDTCPWTVEQVLDVDFLPEATP